VEVALIEMYLAGVSVRRVEDVTQAPWGTRASAGLVSKLNKQIHEKIELWGGRKLEGSFPDGNSALMLVTARLRYVAGRKWGTRKYVNMALLTGDTPIEDALQA
jgi:hypothetical protein